jgi:hypothetical protein
MIAMTMRSSTRVNPACLIFVRPLHIWHRGDMVSASTSTQVSYVICVTYTDSTASAG